VEMVDFGDCAGLPGPFRAGLRRWLAAFDVTPRDDLAEALASLSANRGMTCDVESWFRGYAVLAVARRGA
ncbi:MAG TPA: SAM-dependent methyltransferase, partial [Roseiarcus sp.]|nr:SAM-dependent methyltransferase [Roseiarcus sp.]